MFAPRAPSRCPSSNPLLRPRPRPCGAWPWPGRPARPSPAPPKRGGRAPARSPVESVRKFKRLPRREALIISNAPGGGPASAVASVWGYRSFADCSGLAASAGTLRPFAAVLRLSLRQAAIRADRRPRRRTARNTATRESAQKQPLRAVRAPAGRARGEAQCAASVPHYSRGRKGLRKRGPRGRAAPLPLPCFIMGAPAASAPGAFFWRCLPCQFPAVPLAAGRSRAAAAAGRTSSARSAGAQAPQSWKRPACFRSEPSPAPKGGHFPIDFSRPLWYNIKARPAETLSRGPAPRGGASFFAATPARSPKPLKATNPTKGIM